jgi:hypothetical protein
MGTFPPSTRLVSSRRTAQRLALSLPGNRAGESTAPAFVGALLLSNASRNIAHVHFAEGQPIAAVGTRLHVYAPSDEGYKSLGQLEVVQSFQGSAHVRPIGDLVVMQIPPGALIGYAEN